MGKQAIRQYGNMAIWQSGNWKTEMDRPIAAYIWNKNTRPGLRRAEDE
jgi:hypothetical protein